MPLLCLIVSVVAAILTALVVVGVRQSTADARRRFQIDCSEDADRCVEFAEFAPREIGRERLSGEKVKRPAALNDWP